MVVPPRSGGSAERSSHPCRLGGALPTTGVASAVVSDRTRSRYRLISADSHVNEPPRPVDRAGPGGIRDRAPRIERFEQGDAWVIEGVTDPINFGMNACAGLAARADDGVGALRRDPPRRLRPGRAPRRDGRGRRRRRGALPDAAAVSQAIFANTDPEFHLAMVQAYNDWLSEYVAYAPERFGGLALLPNRGVEGAVAEIERVLDRPGIRGVVMGCYPNGTLEHRSPRTTRCSGTLAEAGVPLSIHVSLTQAMPSAHRSPAAGLRPLLRRAEPDRRDDLRRRVRPLPGARRRVRRGRLRLGAVLQGADRQQLPAPRSRSATSRSAICRASTSSATSTSRTSPTRSACATATTSASSACCGRATTRTSAPTGPTRGARSRRRCRACPATERELILAGNAVRLYGFG